MAIVVDREEALSLISQFLDELDSNVKLEIARSDSTFIIRPQLDRAELLQWAERIGDRYDDVFRKLAEF